MKKRSLAEQIGGSCKHFTGVQNDTCKAGVNYLALAGGNRTGYACRLPCTGDEGCSWAKEEKVVPCALREWWTPEEVQAQVDEIHKRTTETITARVAITDYLKANNKPLRKIGGAIPCPICKTGTLGFSIASNGHCHATCSTPDCVSWME